MTIVRSVFALLFVVGCSAISLAEPILWDDLLGEYSRAGRSIAAGDRREEVLASLRLAIEKNSDSRYLTVAKELERDIEISIDQAKRRAKAGRTPKEAPAEFLSESKMPQYLLAYPANWKQGLPNFMKNSPDDPAVRLLQLERKSIDDLLPQLDNASPARSFDGDFISDRPKIPRVCDLALGLVEKASGCKFHFNATSGEYFHESPLQRAKTIERIEAWWRDNKNKSVAAGIRDQLPHGDFYAKITMAENLIRVVGDDSPEDREYGFDLLRRVAGSEPDPSGVRAAEALAELGDLSPVQRYTDSLRAKLNQPGRYWSNTIQGLFYLAKHGGQDQWELILAIAQKDLHRERVSKSGERAYVLGSLLNSPQAAISPHAIPLLGLGLTRTERSGSRYINETFGSQSFSTADIAAEYLQKQTGQEFGYEREASADERSAAIERAQKWWNESGQTKFTFDFIEQHLIKPANRNELQP